jgi:hypothetical protein
MDKNDERTSKAPEETFASKLKVASRAIFSRNNWTFVVELGAIAAVAISVYQIKQGAQDRQASVELERRLMMSQLALDVHETAMSFISALSQDYFDQLRSAPSKKESGSPVLSGDAADLEALANAIAVPASVRALSIQLDGAVSRARLINDAKIVSCLFAIEHWASGVVEEYPNSHGSSDLESVAVALGDLPSMISDYLTNGVRETVDATESNVNTSKCEFMSEIELTEDTEITPTEP